MARVTPLPDSALDAIADEHVIQQRVAPAAAVGFALLQGNAQVAGVGAGGTRGSSPVTPTTPFDLASLTKPFVALAGARLVQHESIGWTDPLDRWLPELRTTETGTCPLEHLFSHRAGLLAHLELFRPLQARRAIVPRRAIERAANARREDCRGARPESGYASLYSDLGFLLGGLALERAAACPLDELVRREVCEPLGLDCGSVRQWLKRGTRPSDIVPTECVGWRGGSLQAVVHDENAWALSGHGLAGHAGLFGTVPSVLALGAELLLVARGQSEWLRAPVLAHMLGPRPNTTLRLGFDSKSMTASSAGNRPGRLTFGHLGFTGTSFWCDPEAGIVTAMLTNRVRPSRANRRIREARPLVHDLLFELALGRREALTP